jgi:hypothetical protein
MSGVSLPILAIRSIVVVSIVGVLSHLLIRYFVSVAKTVSPEETGQPHNSVPQKVDRTTDRNKNR